MLQIPKKKAASEPIVIDSESEDEASDSDSDGSFGSSSDSDSDGSEDEQSSVIGQQKGKAADKGGYDFSDNDSDDDGGLRANKIANLEDPRLRDLLSDTPLVQQAPSRLSHNMASHPAPARTLQESDWVFK